MALIQCFRVPTHQDVEIHACVTNNCKYWRCCFQVIAAVAHNDTAGIVEMCTVYRSGLVALNLVGNIVNERKLNYVARHSLS